MNFKLLAIKISEGLKYNTTINEINRIASAIFEFPLTDYPNSNITSTRSQLTYSWIMTLSNQPISDEKKINFLIDFVNELTPDDSPLRRLIVDMQSSTTPTVPSNTTAKTDEFNLTQLIGEGDHFLEIMQKIDSGETTDRLHQDEIKQWIKDVELWAATHDEAIPKPGNIFEWFEWEPQVLGYVSRVTHLLKLDIGKDKKNIQFDYDVALSFAGEDRRYAEDLAKCLQKNHIKFFYDKYEKADLWGKDLYTHLAEIYQERAKFCVMFISKNYAEKLWTNHERQNAQARAFKDNQEYILPIKLDDTHIAGLPQTTAYVDIRHSSIDEICKLLIEKLRKEAIRKT